MSRNGLTKWNKCGFKTKPYAIVDFSTPDFYIVGFFRESHGVGTGKIEMDLNIFRILTTFFLEIFGQSGQRNGFQIGPDIATERARDLQEEYQDA